MQSIWSSSRWQGTSSDGTLLQSCQSVGRLSQRERAVNYSHLTKAASPIRQTQSGVPELILVLCVILLAGLLLL